MSFAAIKEIHHRFYALLPDDLLWIENPDTGEQLKVVPGQLRDRDVRVGQHVPISPGAVPRFLARYEGAYGRLGKTDAILSAAASHHRLLWIHPFLDGNGRVARLVSHASLLETLDTGGIWSVARGLARNVAAYKSHLANCDRPRRNDPDGRGNLSEEALASFTRFFLQMCIDQVRFMEALVQPDRLRIRILMWTEEEVRLGHLPPKSGSILEAVLYRSELPRGDVANIVGTGDRQARRIVSALLDKGVLISESARATTPRIPSRTRVAMAARAVPGKDGVAARPDIITAHEFFDECPSCFGSNATEFPMASTDLSEWKGAKRRYRALTAEKRPSRLEFSLIVKLAFQWDLN